MDRKYNITEGRFDFQDKYQIGDIIKAYDYQEAVDYNCCYTDTKPSVKMFIKTVYGWMDYALACKGERKIYDYFDLLIV